jgi:hypothetical protein
VFWRSKQVALVLIGSTAALAGFSSLAVHHGRWSSTTQPTTNSSYGGSHYYHSGHYYGGSSYSSGSSGSSHAGSTSHGGFGSTGHAASGHS